MIAPKAPIALLLQLVASQGLLRNRRRLLYNRAITGPLTNVTTSESSECQTSDEYELASRDVSVFLGSRQGLSSRISAVAASQVSRAAFPSLGLLTSLQLARVSSPLPDAFWLFPSRMP